MTSPSRARKGASVLLTSLLSALLTSACGTVDAARHGALTRELVALEAARSPPDDGERLFAELAHLDREALVGAVLARNPNLESARLGWRAALAEVPQATALEDPTVAYALAPLSIPPISQAFGDDVPFGQTLRLNQRFPFPGKLDLRGAVALFEAEAARGQYQQVALELALLSSLLLADRWEVQRALEVNREHTALLEELKRSAEAGLEVGRSTLQDPLEAEVELANLMRTQLALEARAEVIEARINALLHRRASAPLPPPPPSLEAVTLPADEAAELTAEALARRPELASVGARIEGARSSVSLAEAQYLPDFAVGAEYTSMFQGLPHQVMVGGALTVPLQLDAKAAAVDEAKARLSRAERERERIVDDVRVEVEAALARLREAARVVALYRERLLPAAEARAPAARAAFEAGRERFNVVIDAERNLRSTELGLEMAEADLFRAAARLERARGGAPIDAEGGDR